MSTINYRFEPITDDDATIAKALESASIPALMVSLVHITGDIELLRARVRPQKAVLGQVDGGLGAEDKAEVRARALEILKAYRDGGCRPPTSPSHERVLEMMNFLVGEEVPVPSLDSRLEWASERSGPLFPFDPGRVRKESSLRRFLSWGPTLSQTTRWHIYI